VTATSRRFNLRPFTVPLIAVAAIYVAARPAAAQVLQVQPATINFASSDPDTVPVVTAAPIRVSYIAAGTRRNPWTITVRAEGDLIAGAATIPIANISWTATPAPTFRNGTLTTVAQTLATGSGINVERGDVTFRFVNSWSHPVGNYTQTVTFTLSSP
jgi:hypothetical protein